MPLSDTIVHVRISGRVQRVGYRAWCAATARKHGLSGWVRNLRTGEVEAVFAGPAETVSTMLSELWTGPALAQVTAVEPLAPPDSVADGFAVVDTA